MANPPVLHFRVHETSGAVTDLPFSADRLIIAGWVGRDEASLRHHIEELASIGIAPPSKTPLFYAAAASLLTQAPTLQVVGAESSGEVEPVLILADGETFVGVGSDHTDRQAEAWSVPHSKQLCGKPVARDLWRFGDVAPHWDQIVLRAWIPGASGGWDLYQEGAVAGLRRPDELAALAGGLASGTAMLCGTLGAIGGIRPASGFRMQLHDPVLGRSIDHAYRVAALPVVS
ncbi:MAG TPA: DUF2848 domain-containing protein [Acetobacteraceae bacterium]|nr:DUF2848 domain-containing protein [Acetobacteraceae bacterium]